MKRVLILLVVSFVSCNKGNKDSKSETVTFTKSQIEKIYDMGYRQGSKGVDKKVDSLDFKSNVVDPIFNL
jgi:hypothetical protein